MLKFIKLSTIPEESLRQIEEEEPNKFTCYKCKCRDTNKLYVIRIDKPINETQSEYISDCYCTDCCPFDMLTELANTYYLEEECLLSAIQKAHLLKRAGYSNSEIAETILKL